MQFRHKGWVSPRETVALFSHLTGSSHVLARTINHLRGWKCGTIEMIKKGSPGGTEVVVLSSAVEICPRLYILGCLLQEHERSNLGIGGNEGRKMFQTTDANIKLW